MKKHTFIAFILSHLTIFGQVGINTEHPKGIFHVDGMKDNVENPSLTQQNDDVIVDNNGNMGIGTTIPTTKLDINAGIIAIRDASQKQGNVLMSDANGIGTWARVGDNGKTSFWRLEGTATFSDTNKHTLIGTGGTGSGSFLDESEISGLRKPTGTDTNDPNILNSNIIVPAGLYFIIIDLEQLNKTEYGRIELLTGLNTANADSQRIYQIYYKEKLTGAAFMYNFTASTTALHVAVAYQTVPGYTRYQLPSTSSFIFKIRFIKLNN
ncbi:hypothetical protein [Dysgonomonas sp. HGC4]|uniref:hypothetical protein n=1 Tax=Dysgonomonas sp. HGC4 TaxID=1658009 RepID=UPI0006815B5C|nr:hypothetical protein [Dysgonomonas sp. HGC4]MBD8347827.1 hypothetical protein [Dysgonomonas sp. HGC4]